MKKILVTAAALMLGTSALAWAPAEKAHMDAMGVEAAQADLSKYDNAEKGILAFSSFDGGDMMKSESAGLEASASTMKSDVPEMFAKWEDPSVDSTAMASADMADVKGAVYAASLEENAPVQTASWDGKAEGSIGQQTGMGGPIEEPQGYPACEPGRGDDNCIQLYERGVVNSLAAWKGSETEVAVGGPYEPAAAGGTKDPAAGATDHAGMDHSQHDMASDGSATADSGKTAAPSMPQSDEAKPAGPGATTEPAPGRD